MTDLLKENKYYCNKDIRKILKYGVNIVEETINYGIEFYNELSLSLMKTDGSAENPIIAGFFSELIDTADGIRLLYRQQCINPASPLVRKLFEIYIQAGYLLNGDSEEKAIAYAAYYLLKTSENGDVSEDIYTKYPSYNIYKSRIKDASPKLEPAERTKTYYEWYEIYEDQRISFKGLSKKIKEDEVYDSVYSLLSQKSHGRLARSNIQTDSTRKANYIREYRYPGDFMKQFVLVHYIMWRFYARMISHYNVDDSVSKNKIQKQKEKMEKMEKMWSNYNFT